jgi:hypothetical protein
LREKARQGILKALSKPEVIEKYSKATQERWDKGLISKEEFGKRMSEANKGGKYAKRGKENVNYGRSYFWINNGVVEDQIDIIGKLTEKDKLKLIPQGWKKGRLRSSYKVGKEHPKKQIGYKSTFLEKVNMQLGQQFGWGYNHGGTHSDDPRFYTRVKWRAYHKGFVRYVEEFKIYTKQFRNAMKDFETYMKIFHSKVDLTLIKQ